MNAVFLLKQICKKEIINKGNMEKISMNFTTVDIDKEIFVTFAQKRGVKFVQYHEKEKITLYLLRKF